jgi:translation initiation factor IF-3
MTAPYAAGISFRGPVLLPLGITARCSGAGRAKRRTTSHPVGPANYRGRRVWPEVPAAKCARAQVPPGSAGTAHSCGPVFRRTGGTASLLWLPRGAHRPRGFLVRGLHRRTRRRRGRAPSATGPTGGGLPAQGGHISAEARINERIRTPEVRLVGPKGEQIGIVSINDALKLAQEADLDLVEVAPTARPPVAKLMDYGKFKYEAAVKARESRKNQTQTIVKEIKLRPKIDPHDYGTKKGHVERFLKAGDKVKVTIMFRGREQSRPELGFRLLQRLAGDVEELGFVESQPKQDGRNMVMVIGPHKKKSETRAHASQPAGRPVPSPRPAAAEDPDAAVSEPAADSAAVSGPA